MKINNVLIATLEITVASYLFYTGHYVLGSIVAIPLFFANYHHIRKPYAKYLDKC